MSTDYQTIEIEATQVCVYCGKKYDAGEAMVQDRIEPKDGVVFCNEVCWARHFKVDQNTDERDDVLREEGMHAARSLDDRRSE